MAAIDRSESSDAIYVQDRGHLELRRGAFSSPAWDPDGDGEHSVAEVHAALVGWSERGATAIGALDADALVGIGLVLRHVRPGVSQLTFLYVTAERRGSRIDVALLEALEHVARAAGDGSLVVSATPSLNTVRFYERRGFRPMPEPLPELFALEPEDMHMEQRL